MPSYMAFGLGVSHFSPGLHLVFMVVLVACFVKLAMDQILFLCLLWWTCIFRYADEHLLRMSWKIPCFIPWMTVFFTSIPLKINNAPALKMGCVLCINLKLFTNNVKCKNSVLPVLLTSCNFQLPLRMSSSKQFTFCLHFSESNVQVIKRWQKTHWVRIIQVSVNCRKRRFLRAFQEKITFNPEFSHSRNWSEILGLGDCVISPLALLK